MIHWGKIFYFLHGSLGMVRKNSLSRMMDSLRSMVMDSLRSIVMDSLRSILMDMWKSRMLDSLAWKVCKYGRVFYRYSSNIMGPLPIGRKQFKFLIVTIDYFTKWVEAEPTATIAEAKITSFIWKNIVYRFRIPNIIISDNGR